MSPAVLPAARPDPARVALDAPRAQGLAARGLQRLVRWYQLAREGRPSPCRYVPSCSSYALEALEVHGALRGGAFAVRRLCRCHPWGGHGYDPVPAPRPSEKDPSCV